MLSADVSYAEPVGNAQLLDVYAPETGDGPFPAVVFHGGSAFRSDNTKRSPQSAGSSPGPVGAVENA